jgi:hypothetical protein
MAMIAYGFLQHRRPRRSKAGKKNQRASVSANFTRPAPRHPRTHRLTDTAISTLQKVDQQQATTVEVRHLGCEAEIYSRRWEFLQEQSRGEGAAALPFAKDCGHQGRGSLVWLLSARLPNQA